jgi:hypothetical protein
MNTAAGVPVPNHRMAIGRIAIGAMGRKLSMIGSRLSRSRALAPMGTPSSRPTARAQAKPAITRPRLCTRARGRSPEAVRAHSVLATLLG